MSTETALPAPPETPPPAPAPAGGGGRIALTLLGIVAAAGLAGSLLLWQRLSSIQEQLARQTADSGAQAIEARTMAREAQDLARETSARLAVTEARVGEVALQRGQLEELMQSLSRTRDENLVVDVEAGLRLAQQQSQLTGSLQPLVAALKSAGQRTDTAGLLGRLDELVRQVDELPLLNAVAQAPAMRRKAAAAQTPPAPGATDVPRWQAALRNAWDAVADEARGLVRVSRIDQPDAVLRAPDQAFFLRENLKLKLLNARLAVLARRMDSARADLASASGALAKYFDPASRRTQSAADALQQLQVHMKTAEMPQLDDTFAALATAAAGR
jgi:uroporphyrin-3 C-methyltransferase